MNIYKNNITLEDIIAAQEEATKKNFPINGDAYTLFLMGVYVEKVGESNEDDIDDTFNKCTNYLNEFLHSKFNNTNKSLIECINEYMEWRLEENKKDAYKNKLSSIEDKIRLLQMEATYKNNELKDKRKELDAKYQAKYENIKEFLIPLMKQAYELRKFAREVKVDLPPFTIEFEDCKIKFAESGTSEIGYYRRTTHDRYEFETWLSFGYDKMIPDKYGVMVGFVKNWREDYKVIATEALDMYVDNVSETIKDCLTIRKNNMMAEEETLEGGEF